MSKDTWRKFSYQAKLGDPSMQPTVVQIQRTNEILPFTEATAILDIASGSGAVFTQLFGSKTPYSKDATLTALDISPAMIDLIKARQTEDDEWAKVHADVCDATDMSILPDASQSHIMSALGIFVIPDSDKALKEARRLLAPGGVFSMTTIAHASWVQEVLAQITVLHPDRKVPFAAAKWQRRELFTAELEKFGFMDVEMHEIPVAFGFEDREKVVEFLYHGLPFMPAVVNGLTDVEIKEAKRAMVDYIAKTYPELPGKLPGLSLLGIGR